MNMMLPAISSFPNSVIGSFASNPRMLAPIEAIKTINAKIIFAELVMSRLLPYLTYRAAAFAAPVAALLTTV